MLSWDASEMMPEILRLGCISCTPARQSRGRLNSSTSGDKDAFLADPVTADSAKYRLITAVEAAISPPGASNECLGVIRTPPRSCTNAGRAGVRGVKRWIKQFCVIWRVALLQGDWLMRERMQE